MMNNTYHWILYMVSAGGQSVSRHFLITKGFSEELIDDCIEKRYIIEVGENTLGEPLYIITDAGRAKRNEQ